MDKNTRQLGIVAQWIALGGQGTLVACTGFGKTRVAILIILRMTQKDPTRRTIVVVPSKKLYDDWMGADGHIAKWGLVGVTVYVINTLIKRTNLDCELLVCDEVHRYASTEFSKLFEIVTYRWILGLTATLERADNKHELIALKAPIFDTVSLAEAQANGYISKFLTFNLAVGLNSQEQKIYDEATQTMNSTFARFEHDFDLAKKCLAGKALGGDSIREAYARRQGWSPSDGDTHSFSPKSLMRYAVQWNRSIATRKKLLYQSESKKLVVERLLQTLSHLKAITFSESVDFADEMARRFPTVSRSYHSSKDSITESYQRVTTYKTKAPKVELKSRQVSGSMLNKRALEEFNDDKSPVRILHTARALDEGFDVEDIELAIIASSTSAPRQNIQRTGRAVRFVPDKLAIIINLYHPSTQDEKWLKDRQSTTRRAIWISTIEELLTHLRDV